MLSLRQSSFSQCSTRRWDFPGSSPRVCHVYKYVILLKHNARVGIVDAFASTSEHGTPPVSRAVSSPYSAIARLSSIDLRVATPTSGFLRRHPSQAERDLRPSSRAGRHCERHDGERRAAGSARVPSTELPNLSTISAPASSRGDGWFRVRSGNTDHGRVEAAERPKAVLQPCGPTA